MPKTKTYSFKAIIYKTGINYAVDVPEKISGALEAVRGYIKVKGTINGFAFRTTLVPVKNGPCRLFTNLIMLNGASAWIGDEVKFVIEQDVEVLEIDYPMPPELKKRLKEKKLTAVFDALTPSRKKEILRYLGFIKTEETLLRNIDKLVTRMEEGQPARIP
ncbi:YdeI/OmpD-associated family protein [Polluticoccus soli]|uniref:YdeI/OmpD-associated family protein n=1 Tax=Polluticoccus soli TaxID=3034150 RepID=UPI0023E17B29|nr:YdeI/OmpD-associated family protein [Flavipsychrobacter sp. JY13-12]